MKKKLEPNNNTKMKQTTIYPTLSRVRQIFVVILMALSSSVSAIEYDWSSYWYGADMQNNSVLDNEDPLWSQIVTGGWNSDFKNQSIQNVISLEFTGDNHKYYNPSTGDWSIDVTFDVVAYDTNNNVFQVNGGNSITLSIDYDGDENVTYIPQDVYAFTGALKVTLTNISVTTTGLGGVVPSDVRLENRMVVNRIHDIDYLIAVNVQHEDNVQNTSLNDNEVRLYWNLIDGAEEYDVEWYFLSEYSANYSSYTLPSDINDKDFTRVTVTDNDYKLNLIYEEGKLFYRVRPVGRYFESPDQRKVGVWSDQTADVITVSPHEMPGSGASKNWTYSAVYAEGGKKKEVVSYFDGSQRNRQSVTKSNTEDQSIIAESYYDFEGRATVQALPSPSTTRDGAIKFYDNFNMNGAGTHGFSKVDFDLDNTTDVCEPSDAKMDNGSGVSNYYSDQNSEKTGMNAYIPDANEYPYTRVTYDRKGRVRMQGGAGDNHNIGSGHETKFYVGRPLQKELDRLFGNEAGHAKHYTVQAVEDANGQLSMTYMDLSGKTKATSLIGEAPTGLEAITSNPGVASTITDDIIVFNEYSTSEQAYILTTPYFVKSTGDHDFSYTLTPETLEGMCGDTDDYDCEYDLLIEVRDECGELVKDDTPADATYSYTGLKVGGANLTVDFTINFTEIGTYTVYKKLSLNQDALDLAVSDFQDFLGTAANTCFDTEQDYIDAALDSIDWSNCLTCQEYCELTGLCDSADCADFNPVDSDGIENSCEDIKVLLAQDMSPGGQYFDNVQFGASTTPNDDWFDANVVDLWDNTLKTSGSFWSDFGFPTGVDTWQEVIDNWDPAWADTLPQSATADNGTVYYGLVDFHPEYCHYKWCVAEAATEAYNHELINVTTWSTAYQNGWVQNVTDPANVTDATGIIDNDYMSGNTLLGDVDDAMLLNESTTGIMAVSGANSIWEDAVDATDAAYTSPTMDDYWNMWKYYYIHKKQEMISDEKISDGCKYLCDQFDTGSGDLPDMVADDSGITGCDGDYEGFQLHFQDPYHLDETYTTGNAGDTTDLNDMHDDLSNQYYYCYVADTFDIETIDVCGTSTNIVNPRIYIGTTIVSGEVNLDCTDNPEPASGAWADSIFVELTEYSYPGLYVYQNGTELIVKVHDVSLDGKTIKLDDGTNSVTLGTMDLFCPDIPDCMCEELNSMYDEIYYDWSGSGTPTSAQVYTEMQAEYLVMYGITVDDDTLKLWKDHCKDNDNTLSTSIMNNIRANYEELLSYCEPEFDPCDSTGVEGLASAQASAEYYEMLQEYTQIFIDAYVTHCFNLDGSSNFAESFDLTAKDYEYHYTLFYHDQAGNLTRTVPPEGVTLLTSAELDATAEYREDPTDPTHAFVKAQHSMVTHYYYNSLNQLVSQNTPDTETTGTWDYSYATGAGGSSATQITAIDMVNTNLGYATGIDGKAYKTTDGGSTWTDITPTGNTKQLNGVDFVNTTHGILVGDKKSGEPLVYGTSDGGSTWTQVTITGVGQDLNAVRYFDGNSAMAVGNSGKILQIDFDGTSYSFSNHSSGSITDNLEDVAFVDDAKGFAVGASGRTVKMTYSGSWTVAAATSLHGSFTGYAVSITPSGDIYTGGIKVVSANNNAYAYYSDDDGSTWTNVYSNTTAGTSILDLHFSTEQDGYIGGNSVMETTNDGATTWESQTVPVTGTINAIAGIGTNQLIVGGYEISSVDAGHYSSRFWYDNIGRLVASQDARQASFTQAEYSYVKYDEQGRLVESGILHADTDPTETEINADNYPDNWNDWTYGASVPYYKEVTATDYDAVRAGVTSPLTAAESSFLRNRVAASYYWSTTKDDPDYLFASFYGYDIHGNVDVLYKENAYLEAIGHHLKRLDYDYDLISGNVNEVTYQKGEVDQFMHRYTYDADNRLVTASTSQDGIIWDQDAKYLYYQHGPLARKEIGEDQVQGIDYAYNINGWLKGTNGNQLIAEQDMGRDGSIEGVYGSGQMHKYFAIDAFGFTLGYHENDYESIGGINSNKFFDDIDDMGASNLGANLYNGNIRHMATALMNTSQVVQDINASIYQYDQLQRIDTVATYLGSAFTGMSNNGDYNAGYTYDGNGNLLSIIRHAHGVSASARKMDEFTYNYIAGTNQLEYVDDAIASGSWTDDIDDQSSANYTYDARGSLISDDAESISNITWYQNGKVREVQRDVDGEDDVMFLYDEMGNRVMKIAKDRESGAVTNQEGWTITHYVMDASGTPMATYKTTYEEVAAGDIKETTKLMDHPIYGSSREGLKDHDEMIYYRRMEVSSYTSDGWFDDYDITETDEGTEEDFGFYQREVGNKKYELSNHLGNVLAVVSDKKLAMDTKKYSYVGGTAEDYSYDSGLDVYYYTPSAGDYELITGTDAIVDYYEPDVQSYSDYYPFGMVMDNRSGNEEGYRYGFNGMEKDDEVKGNGNSYTTEFRQYDPRLGRWLSLDPVTHHHFSPYSAFDNNPIYWADPSGADAIKPPPETILGGLEWAIGTYNPVVMASKQLDASGYGNNWGGDYIRRIKDHATGKALIEGVANMPTAMENPEMYAADIVTFGQASNTLSTGVMLSKAFGGDAEAWADITVTVGSLSGTINLRAVEIKSTASVSTFGKFTNFIKGGFNKLFNSRNRPKNGSMSNLEVRQWYNEKVNKMNTDVAPTELNARKINRQRNLYKQQARDLMADRETAAKLDVDRPILDFEFYVNKYSEQGYQGAALWEKIINVGKKTNKEVNKKFGINND